MMSTLTAQTYCQTLLVGFWGLLHQTAIITYPHHNAEGPCTWVMPYNGCKVWMCIKVKKLLHQKKFASFLAMLANRENLMSSFEGDVECETIYLYPGNLVIMPPGQMHAIYTPVACFCRGKHFFSYNALHLTEQSQHVDKLKGQYITNKEHRGTLETMAHMVIALPIISRSKVWLSMMGNTLVQQTKQQTSECHTQAKAVATKVLHHFGITTELDSFKFVEDPEVDLNFKGKEVLVYGLLEEFHSVA
ncbi:hypothetical protein JVT61DRAFT_11072 [Boletus reticuloceps]|uniref:JmjC domain-containing protein n=1 Tax=Boletus reticuloceps TaxID=495285 RepID=A0A8I2YF68_9AGAM|nr:hypothetical protein JVT61DRAFT_11072 [Boletus reticuloceps]